MTPNTVTQPAPPADSPPEQELFRVRPSMSRRYPVRCLGYVVLTLASVGTGLWALLTGFQVLALFLLAVGVALAVRFAYWYAKMSATTLVVTDRRVTLETGLLARQASEFPLEAVTDIQVDQGVVPRLFDVGDLVLTTGANADKRQMVMMAVGQPLAVADRIRQAVG